jgi:hypothetical protein
VYERRAVVAELLLELLEEDLACLAGAEAGDALELAQLVALGGLELLGLGVEVAGAVLERALALGGLLEADAERLLLGDHPLFDASELGTPLAQLGVDLVAQRGARGGVGRDRDRPGSARGAVPVGAVGRAALQ